MCVFLRVILFASLFPRNTFTTLFLVFIFTVKSVLAMPEREKTKSLSLRNDLELLSTLRKGSTPVTKPSSGKRGREDGNSSSIQYILATDEAGRGCAAGPVCVSATCFTMTPHPPSSSKTRRRSDGVVEPSTALVLDSKQMNAKQRDETFDYFCNAVLGVDRQTFLEQTLFHTDELPPVSKKPTKPIMEKGSLYFRKERTATVVVEHWDKSQPCMLGLSTVLVPPAVIDTVNISNASLEGMAQVVGQLAEAMNTRIKSKKGLFAGAEPLTRENTVVLVDGKCLPWCFLPSKEREKILVDANKEKETKRRHVCRQRIGNDYATSEFAQFPCYAIVKGDSLYYSIAASSVCSKVIRDTFVEEVLDKQFPLYRFAEHKGYCTELHNSTLKKYGIVKEVHRLSYDPVRQLLNE